MAVTVPPEMVTPPLLKMPLRPLPPLAVRLSFSPPVMVRLPLLEMPLPPEPTLLVLSPPVAVTVPPEMATLLHLQPQR